MQSGNFDTQWTGHYEAYVHVCVRVGDYACVVHRLPPSYSCASHKRFAASAYDSKLLKFLVACLDFQKWTWHRWLHCVTTITHMEGESNICKATETGKASLWTPLFSFQLINKHPPITVMNQMVFTALPKLFILQYRRARSERTRWTLTTSGFEHEVIDLIVTPISFEWCKKSPIHKNKVYCLLHYLRLNHECVTKVYF